MRDKIRQWLQWFLGILSMEKAAQRRHEEQRDVYLRMIDLVTELSLKVGRIENMLVEKHIPQKPASMPVYDWEQVQTMELEKMLKNPKDGEL